LQREEGKFGVRCTGARMRAPERREFTYLEEHGYYIEEYLEPAL
jgi:hypothetical protein